MIDQQNRSIPTPFYLYQIQPAEQNWKDHRRINKILSRKGTKLLVNFKGESTDNKNWITKTQQKKLKGNFR